MTETWGKIQIDKCNKYVITYLFVNICVGGAGSLLLLTPWTKATY